MNYFYDKEIDGFLVEGVHDEIPQDAISVSEEEFNNFIELRSQGYTLSVKKNKIVATPPHELTKDEILKQKTAEFLAVVDNIMNETAKKAGYDSLLTACSYTLETSPFYQESISFQKWRDNVYQWGYSLIAKIQSGEMKMPESFEEIASGMPQLEQSSDLG